MPRPERKPIARVTRVTDLEEVKKLLTRPSAEEREILRKQGIIYVGTDEQFAELQRMVAETGAILKGHFDLGSGED